MTPLDALVTRIAALPRPVLLAFDVDGTLAPIVEDPDAARVPREVTRALRTLARARGVRVALVTGRDATSLARVVRIPRAYRAIEHGRRVLAPGASPREPVPSPALRARLDAFEAWARVHALPAGARLERKPQSRVVHVRALAARDPAGAERLLARADRAARRADLVPRSGRAVLEAALGDADKSTALASLARATGAKSVVYAGDDRTDRAAIARAGALGGLGIHVRSAEQPRAPRGTAAVVPGSDALGRLVLALAQRLGPERRR